MEGSSFFPSQPGGRQAAFKRISPTLWAIALSSLLVTGTYHGLVAPLLIARQQSVFQGYVFVQVDRRGLGQIAKLRFQ